MAGIQEGNLVAPTRHTLGQDEPGFWDETALFAELERVFDICHGCRRCVSLCASFPTLFDLVDDSETMEVDGVAKQDYWKIVDHCYLCDLCYMTKCPYVPPHEWNVDFPHLMLRAKMVKFRKGDIKKRDRLITSTDTIGKFASLPVITQTVNTVNSNTLARRLLDKTLGIHPDAPLPKYHSRTLYKRDAARDEPAADVVKTAATTGKVALFATCYGIYNEPDIALDLIRVYEHNGIPVHLVEDTRCCGMPKLELGDLEAVIRSKDHNIPLLGSLVDEGWDIVTPIPSCTLMFKQELPLMFPDERAGDKGQTGHVRPVRIPDAASPGKAAKYRIQTAAWQDFIPCRLPPEGAEYRHENPRRAEPRARYRSDVDRTLLRPRRHLYGEERVSRQCDENLQTGGQSRKAGA